MWDPALAPSDPNVIHSIFMITFKARINKHFPEKIKYIKNNILNEAKDPIAEKNKANTPNHPL